MWGKRPLNSVKIGLFRFSENITNHKSTPSFSQKIFITGRSRVQIPVSLQSLCRFIGTGFFNAKPRMSVWCKLAIPLNRGSFVVLREVFVISYQKHEPLMLIFLLLLWYYHLCIFTYEKSNPAFIDNFNLFNCYSAKPKRKKGCYYSNRAF